MGGAGLRCARDAGSGSVVMVAVIAVLMLCVATIGAGAARAVAHARAQGAADMAAVAAAHRARGDVALGAGHAEVQLRACEAAGEVAARNGASLGRCAVNGADATVEVVTGAGLSRVTAIAVAGPRPPA